MEQRGGDHPEGHPGIDFDVNQGTSIRAAASGTVGYVDASTYTGSQTITVSHNNSYSTYHTGFFVDVFVGVGESITQGKALASADFFQNHDVASVHFELNQSVAICPEPFFTAEAISDLNNLLESSNYSDKDKYPNICN